MRSAIVYYCLGLLALSGCASAPGYRSPAAQLPASFREASDTDRAVVAPSPALVGREGPHPLAPSSVGREGPHPLAPSPFGRGGTKDGPAVSPDY